MGFFTVVGHGIPLEQIDDQFACSRDFFAQSLEAKETQCPFRRDLNSGKALSHSPRFQLCSSTTETVL